MEERGGGGGEIERVDKERKRAREGTAKKDRERERKKRMQLDMVRKFSRWLKKKKVCPLCSDKEMKSIRNDDGFY